jgi:hypothetical protein
MKAKVGIAVLALTLGISTTVSAQPAPEPPKEQLTVQRTAPPDPNTPDRTANLPPPRPVDGSIVMQSETTVLFSILSGAAIQGPDGQSVASVKDLIIGTDGRIKGAVIGVDSFLGIGEHDAGLKWKRLRLQPDNNGRATVVLNAAME